MATIKHIRKTPNGLNLYDVFYWNNGKRKHRRIKAQSKADVERIVALDSFDQGISIKWSEAWEMFKKFKAHGDTISRSLENTQHAVDAFIQTIGDIALEKTSPEIFKDFMIRYAGKSERSTPDAANHQRKELLAVARFIKRHTGKLPTIPFEDVPKLPTTIKKRAPIPTGRIQDYIAALPEYIRRPVLMVLFYGLRSSAICNIDEKDIDADYLAAIDKGDVQRKIPMDDTLTDIIEDARQHKAAIENVSPAPLFVNSRGQRWTRCGLLRSAQTAWKRAGLKPVKIHEIRHTLGTEAGKMFPVGIIQVLMGHRSRKSSENYFHPQEEMATEARKKLVRFLCGLDEKQQQNSPPGDTPEHPGTRQVMCPCCGHNFIISNE